MRVSALEAAAAEDSVRLTQLIDEVWRDGDARYALMEEFADQRTRQFSRELEERAQALEAFVRAYSISAITDLALKVEQRAQVAEQSAMAFAAESANKVLAAARDEAECVRRDVRYVVSRETVAAARAGEERAQAAEVAAKAGEDVGLATLAKSIAASSRAMQRRAGALAESIDSLQAQLADHQERVRELEQVGAALSSLILVNDSASEAVTPAPPRLRAIQSTIAEISAEAGPSTVTANDEIAVSHRLVR